VGTKLDLPHAPGDDAFDLLISGKTGQGIGTLLEEIGKRAHEAAAGAGDVLPSRMRHVALLERCAKSLEMAVEQEAMPLELRAEELRDASFNLGKISGAVDVEDLLDTIFSEFCIGK
jgi:tRNA modification GTPase